MRKILITGAGSFIGTSFENYIKKHANHDEYEISVMDTLTGKLVGGESEDIWNFDGYDVVFHVAGIAHADVGKVTEEGKELYRKVNTELAIETAKKAKAIVWMAYNGMEGGRALGEVLAGEWFDIDTAIKTVRESSIIQKLLIYTKENML